MKKFTTVFVVSFIISLIFIIWGVLTPKNLATITSLIQTFLQDKFGWFYLLSATGFLVFSLFLIFSPYGRIKLGKDTDQPEFSSITWFAMLFSGRYGDWTGFLGCS